MKKVVFYIFLAAVFMLPLSTFAQKNDNWFKVHLMSLLIELMLNGQMVLATKVLTKMLHLEAVLQCCLQPEPAMPL